MFEGESPEQTENKRKRVERERKSVGDEGENAQRQNMEADDNQGNLVAEAGGVL